jgi:hypothetical protein
MKILELAARLVPGDLLEADDGLHRIMVIERHKGLCLARLREAPRFLAAERLGSVDRRACKPRQFKELEHVLIEKVDQLLRDML